MGKKLRIAVWVILGFGAIFIAAMLIINAIIKNKVENFITNRLPPNMEGSYENLSLGMLEGTVTINNALFQIKNTKNDTLHTKVSVEKISLSDISYSDYFFKEEIHIQNIKLEHPIIIYHKNRLVKSKDSTAKAPLTLYKPVLVDRLQIENANLYLYDGTKDSLALYAKNITVAISEILVNNKTLAKRIPIDYKGYAATGDSIFTKVGIYENLTVSNFKIKNTNANFGKIHLFTKYSRSELSKIIKKERDHYNVFLDSLKIENLNFGFNNRKLFAKSKKVVVFKPDAAIYRNKLETNDPTIKPLYSKMLRTLPINLTVDSLKIKNGAISYTEKVKAENTGGTIHFSGLDANIANVSNTYTSPTKTEIAINAIFMKNTPLNVQWNFDVNNPNDHFLFKAEVGHLTASDMNPFMKPNLHVELEGETNKVIFTIDGNANESIVDMLMNYDAFKVNILNNKGNKKNRFLSAIANVFISKDSNKNADGFREGKGSVTPDRTKSFFNYLWLNVKEGLLRSMTGLKSNIEKTEAKASRLERREARKKERAERRKNKNR